MALIEVSAHKSGWKIKHKNKTTYHQTLKELNQKLNQILEDILSIQDKVKEEMAGKESSTAADKALLPKPDHPKSLRDEFAMSALSGMLANPTMDFIWEKYPELAYKIADAMMEERK